MKYAIKITEINIKTLQTHLFFMGKDGYVHDEIDYVDGWSRKTFAERYIKKDIKFMMNKPIDDYNVLQSDTWLVHYEIIEMGE